MTLGHFEQDSGTERAICRIHRVCDSITPQYSFPECSGAVVFAPELPTKNIAASSLCPEPYRLPIGTSAKCQYMVHLSETHAMKKPGLPAAENRYDPNRLLDTLMRTMDAGNDASFARKLKLDLRILTMIRNGSTSITASMMMLFHEASGISIQELRELLQDRRAKFRLSCRYLNG
jgi:hypothetical protein